MNRYEIKFKGLGFSAKTVTVMAESDEEALHIFLANTPGVEKENIVSWHRSSATDESSDSGSMPPYVYVGTTKGPGSYFDIGTPSNYRTTKGFGSFISSVGWIGVAISVLVGVLSLLLGGAGMPTFLTLAGTAFGIINAIFFLLIVVNGQLLQAQVEVANNSRQILEYLKSQRQRE